MLFSLVEGAVHQHNGDRVQLEIGALFAMHQLFVEVLEFDSL
jgi:hypothetical protein